LGNGFHSPQPTGGWSVGHLGSTIAATALSASSAHAGLSGPAIGLLAPSAFGLFREELEGEGAGPVVWVFFFFFASSH
jgi:hypothetical protein